MKLATEVISRTDRGNPADRVLRAVLKETKAFDQVDASLVAQSVFAYFRWFGWLNLQLPLPKQIISALQFDEKFRKAPESFRNDELIRCAVPDWTALELNVSLDWVRTLQTRPQLWLRARRHRGKSLAEELGNCRVFGCGKLEDSLEYQGDQDLFHTSQFRSGDFEVQDLNSQAVGFICAPQPGQTWWDACAGEGGKTLHLSDLMENKGLIWASDRAAWRLEILKRRAARAQVFNYRPALWLQTSQLPTKTKFDGVLVDAPCSGLGTWQRNPHARWTTSITDVLELSNIQRELLVQAAKTVKPGGKLIYSVCTLTRTETKGVATDFQQNFPDFEPIPIRAPWKETSAPATQLFLWPQEFGASGMFIAAWQKRYS